MSRKKSQQRQGQCVYCGSIGPIEDEHVFAEVLFIELDPQMLTVPACRSCNRKKSLGDRDLRNYMTLHIEASKHPNSMVHAERMVHSNVRTKLWLERVIKTAKVADLVNENGLVLSSALVHDNFNKDRVLDTIKMTIRGLYYHHTGDLLDVDCSVAVKEIAWSDGYTFAETYASRIPGELHSKGNNVVFWKYFINESELTESIWVLCFNNGVMYFGATGQLGTMLQAGMDQRRTNDEMGDIVRQLLSLAGEAPIRIPRSSDGQLHFPE